VLAELKAIVADRQARLIRAVARLAEDRGNRLAAASRGLPRPADILALANQRFDLAAGRLNAALQKNAAAHERELIRVAGRFSPGLLDRPRRVKSERVTDLWNRLPPAMERRLGRATEALNNLDKLRQSFNPDGPLKRGFARVHHADGHLARAAADLKPGEALRLVFQDGERGAMVAGGAGAPAAPRPARKAAGGGDQSDLFGEG